MPVSVTCDNCGAQVKKVPSRVFERNFCSKKCWADYFKGERSPRWRGGIKTLSSGRIMVHRPDHPAANKQGYILRYRAILEETIGRYLRPDEQVHHINGNKTDDHPENLMVMSASEHTRHHNPGGPRTHCRRGHALTPENTAVWKSQRRCKTCLRLLQERSRRDGR